jgi:hypothetical protein
MRSGAEMALFPFTGGIPSVKTFRIGLIRFRPRAVDKIGDNLEN